MPDLERFLNERRKRWIFETQMDAGQSAYDNLFEREAGAFVHIGIGGWRLGERMEYASQSRPVMQFLFLFAKWNRFTGARIARKRTAIGICFALHNPYSKHILFGSESAFIKRTETEDCFCLF